MGEYSGSEDDDDDENNNDDSWLEEDKLSCKLDFKRWDILTNLRDDDDGGAACR